MVVVTVSLNALFSRRVKANLRKREIETFLFADVLLMLRVLNTLVLNPDTNNKVNIYA